MPRHDTKPSMAGETDQNEYWQLDALVFTSIRLRKSEGGLIYAFSGRNWLGYRAKAI